MLIKIFKLLQDIGWVFDSYEDFMFWITHSKKTIDRYWDLTQDDLNEELSESLGFVIDLLSILIKEEE